MLVPIEKSKMKRQLSYDSADMSSWSADNAERLQYYLRFLEGNSSENGPENGSGDSTQNFFLMEEIKNLKKDNLVRNLIICNDYLKCERLGKCKKILCLEVNEL